MSAYKRLNKQDAFITTYTAHKTWAVAGSEFALYGITTFVATGSYSASLKQLYYPTKSESNQVSSSYEYYPQTTLHFEDSRRDFTTSKLISIPRDLYGTHIDPKSIQVLIQTKPNETTVLDDGEGNLYVSASDPRQYVGDVIYPHGILNITSGSTIPRIVTNITFKSSQPIFTHNYHCKVREFENNFTYNPTALTSSLKTVYDNEGNIFSTSASISDGKLNNNVTGSSFTPYITTVGLYNDANELIAVGKLNRPVPKPANTEMTIIVKIDI